MIIEKAITEFHNMKYLAIMFKNFSKLMKEWTKTPEWKRNNQIK